MRYHFNHPDVNARGPVHSHRMLQLLEVRALPREGMPARMLPGTDSTGAHTEIRVWVAPHVPKLGKRWNGSDWVPAVVKTSVHRVRCACPGCGTELSAGRLFQHRCLTAIERRVAELKKRGWSVDTVFIPEQCAAMHDPAGKAWHVEVDGLAPMPEAVA